MRRAAASTCLLALAGAPAHGQDRVEALPCEKAFFASLDKAWSTGDRKRVLPHFDFVHAGLRNALLRRIDPGVRRERRESKILATFETKRKDGRVQRACFVSARIRPVATPHREQSVFEVLVFRPRTLPLAAKTDPNLRAMLLMPTTRQAQEHVRHKSEGTTRGAPIGTDLTGGCPACNWRITTPMTGNWAVIIRDATYAACSEHVEIYNLDHDLMLGVRVEPDSIPGLNVDLEAYLGRTHCMLGRMFGLPEKRATLRPFKIAKTDGYTCDLAVGDRTWRLIGLRTGPITYLLNVQAPTSLLTSEEMKVEKLLETFSLVSTSKTKPLKEILDAHARGKFLPDGRYRSRVLGFEIKPPFPEWTHTQPMGGWAAQAYWGHRKFGRFVVFCLDSAQLEVDEGQAQRYLLSWLAREQRAGTLTDAQPGEIYRRRIGGIRGGFCEFTCGARHSKGRARAFVCSVPHGKRLILIHGCAEPTKEQDRVFDRMVEAAKAVKLTK